MTRVADRYMERSTFESRHTDTPVDGRDDNVYEPVANDGNERGRNWHGHARETSSCTRAFLHPKAAAAVLVVFAMIASVAAARTSRKRVKASLAS